MEDSFSKRIRKAFYDIGRKISDHSLISSVLLCLVFFLLAILFCDPKYESNDDFWTDTVLSGVWTGECDQHIMFSNILLGYILKGVYSLIPYFSFYFVLLEIMGLISLIVIVWIILKHCRINIGLLSSIVFLVCFSDDIFILVQFTKIASAAIAAGGFLFLEGLYEKTLIHTRATVIIGSVLFVLGSMLRFDCIYCVLPFLFIHFVLLIHKTPVRRIIVGFLLCLALLCTSFAFQKANGYLWDMDPEYKRVRELDEYRYPITDVPKPEYEALQPELEEIGISGVDYYMAVVWGFTDLSVFTPDKLNRFGEILSDYNSGHTGTLSRAFHILDSRAYWSYPGVLGILLISVLVALNDRKRLFTIISSIIASAALLFYFASIGRVVYRVEFGILFSAFTALACSLGRNPREIVINRRLINFAVYSILVAIFLYHIGTYIPDVSYKTLDDKEYADYVDRVFSAPGYHLECYTTVVSKRRPHEQLLNVIENDSSHFYLIDEEVLVNINLDHAPWIRPDQYSVGKNCHILGGCYMMQFPGETYAYESNGIDPVDPYKSLVNDNVFVVDNEYYLLKLYYIQYHYYPDAQIAYVGEKSGRSIWKYYLPE